MRISVTLCTSRRVILCIHKLKLNKALDENSSLSYISPAIWNHTVLPATRHKWTCPALTPASKLVSIYLPWRDGRLSWPRLPGNAPTGSWTRDLSITSQTPYHYTTESCTFVRDFLCHRVYLDMYLCVIVYICVCVYISHIRSLWYGMLFYVSISVTLCISRRVFLWNRVYLDVYYCVTMCMYVCSDIRSLWWRHGIWWRRWNVYGCHSSKCPLVSLSTKDLDNSPWSAVSGNVCIPLHFTFYGLRI